MKPDKYKVEPFYKVLEWCRLTMTDLATFMSVGAKKPISKQSLSQRVRKQDLKLSLFEAVAKAANRPVVEVLQMYYDAKGKERNTKD